jgi:two-component system chemotaxis response regulator CheB
VEALTQLAGGFPADLPASVLITLHLSNQVRSSLDELLSFAGPLQASFARDGERLRKGHIYVAPPDRHLLVEGDQIALGTGPRENNSRPAIDPMLRSIALCCCHRAIGVVLTGTLGDGASGLWVVNQCGGRTVVQDPRRAAFREMPQAALDLSPPDHVVDLDRMGPLLESLVRQPAGERCEPPEGIAFEVEIAKGAGGYATDKMDAPAHDENLRRALGSAQRALEERVALAGRLHSQAQAGGHHHLMATWSSRRREYEHEMNVIRDAVRRMEGIAARAKARRPDPAVS